MAFYLCRCGQTDRGNYQPNIAAWESVGITLTCYLTWLSCIQGGQKTYPEFMNIQAQGRYNIYIYRYIAILSAQLTKYR